MDAVGVSIAAGLIVPSGGVTIFFPMDERQNPNFGA
jgi:hypothetical protein